MEVIERLRMGRRKVHGPRMRRSTEGLSSVFVEAVEITRRPPELRIRPRPEVLISKVLRPNMLVAERLCSKTIVAKVLVSIMDVSVPL